MKRALTAVALLAAFVLPAAALATVANDHSKAKMLLLTPADLPGYKVDHSASTGPGNLECSKYKAAGVKETAQADGVTLTKQTATGLTMFVSKAKTYTDAATARTVWTHSFVNRAAGSCVLEQLKKELTKQLKLTNVKLVPVKLSVGSIELAMWDITAQTTLTGSAQPFEVVFAGYLHGRGVVSLLTMAIGPASTADASRASMAMTRKLATSGL